MYRRLFGLRKYDSASFMYALNKVDNLDTVIRKHMYGFMQRVCNSNNILINAVTASTLFRPKSVWPLSMGSHSVCN